MYMYIIETILFLLFFLKETPRLGVMVALFLLSQVSNKHDVQTFLPVLVSLSVFHSICLPVSACQCICHPAIPYVPHVL